MSSSLNAPDVRDVPVWIYGLSDPTDGLIRYVGKSENPLGRIGNHASAGSASVLRWVSELSDRGVRVQTTILHKVPAGTDAAVFEAQYIAHFQTHGLLLNSQFPDNAPPAAQRRKAASGPRTTLGPLFSEGSRLLWVALRNSGASNRGFARNLNTDPAVFFRWIYGDRRPSVEHAARLTSSLGIPCGAWSMSPIEPFSIEDADEGAPPESHDSTPERDLASGE